MSGGRKNWCCERGYEDLKKTDTSLEGGQEEFGDGETRRVHPEDDSACVSGGGKWGWK